MRRWGWFAIGAVVAAGCRSPQRSARAACLHAAGRHAPETAELCERGWAETGDVAIAVTAAEDALVREDAPALARWASRAPHTVEGARVLHYWGELQRFRGDFAGAEIALRQALDLRIDRDPVRAANTALALLALGMSAHPAEHTLELARIAWQQAEAGGHPLMRAMASAALVEVLVDVGELRAAQLVADAMSAGQSAVLHDIAEARVQAARGRFEVALALYARASEAPPTSPESSFRLGATLEAVHATVRLGRLGAARTLLDRVPGLIGRDVLQTDMACRLAAARATLQLAEGDHAGARETAEAALAVPSRDSARVLLENIRGDALAQLGDPLAAEAAWRQAADLVETWRASIPMLELRGGLIDHHRHALESWFDSAARRGDVDHVLEIASRVLGRGLLDRIQASRDATPIDAATATADVIARFAARRDATAPFVARGATALRDARTDLVVFVLGARDAWAIQHLGDRWSVRNLGARGALLRLVDDYRRDVANPRAAAALGELLFPRDVLAHATGPLAVILDAALAEIALAGLRTGGTYLIERTLVVEVLAPSLLEAAPPVRTWTDAVVIGDPRGDLPGAAREADEVATLLAVRPDLAAAATRTALLRGQAARVLHVATHASIEHGVARLALRDATMSTLEVLRAGLAPRLAVIASCRSAADADPGRSLVAAFLASGAVGVVGAKAAIDDEASRALVLAFYRAGGADRPIEALAAAQRAAIAAGRSPRQWAAFSFFGGGGGFEQHER